jgi:hypothetical protein
MAAPVSAADVRAWPLREYSEIRGSLKTGDLLFASGNYFFSRLIRRVTRSYWSHVGIIYVDPALERVLLLESVESFGVRFAPLSKYTCDYSGDGRPYDGELVIASVDGVESQQIKAALRHGLDQLTDPYDRGEVFRILARMVLGRMNRFRQDVHAYICSELVHECFLAPHAQVKLGMASRGYVCPGDIWADPKVKLKYRLARHASRGPKP